MNEPRQPGDTDSAAGLGLVPSVNEILDGVAVEAGLSPGSFDETFTPGEKRQIEDGAGYPALFAARLLACTHVYSEHIACHSDVRRNRCNSSELFTKAFVFSIRTAGLLVD